MNFHISYKAQRMFLILGFLIVPLALLVTFSLYPAIKLVLYSFTSWNGLTTSYPWVGLHNYIEIFRNPSLFGVFIHNFSYFIGGLVQNVIALGFALLLSKKVKIRNGFRSILFIPYMLNAVAVVYIFQFMYQDNGAINTILRVVGLGALATDWIGNNHVINWALAFVSLWEYFPFNMVIYLAAIQSIPEDMYEAALLDGASAWQTLWYVTLPNLRAIIQVNLLLTVSGALEAFNIPFIMTNSAPAAATFLTQTMNVAFVFNNYGLASAMAIVLLVIVVLVISIQRKIVGGGDDVV
ncbi:binding-protein-dependent transport systems inner membrane component [Alicyclobacillus hesperidum URH17-3-68]|uniref:carbohydrate ABC transporter permease n=1 Tax=Alicyclobacillus hesperidum TaxID=89784 RepID=UPI000281B5B0|nr:sugar ABC transporter permease [Alicyclobacillus hesperidum]EJY56541.1 binding-protein-dependent transport systems inner membrane component [Alicyclobacillus hesperidum URH17-3-68]